MEKMEKKENQEVLHEFNKDVKISMFSTKFLAIVGVAIIFGLGSGYLLASYDTGSMVSKINGTTGESSVSKGTIVGSSDTKTFKDTAEGVLEEGGIEDEGQYHLVRPGGDSQNVYLTSSIVDLSVFVKKKVKVWGETNAAKRAGWLMDVGRVEVLE
ncbi:MAG: hypothetical protein HYV37_01620 [Candidatus Levyibacteriota bacterium]|nr:MAG: hypothetical protein HYV37_01620 [Candidatus Levybacteria bacterium]